ncbi:unnamed protein product [Brassica rapa subsp. narinosa]
MVFITANDNAVFGLYIRPKRFQLCYDPFGMEVLRAAPEPETTSNPLLGNSPCCSCLAVGSSWWQRKTIDLHSNHHHEPRWWIRAILKIREWSEIVAGPRWKTFIRQFNRDQRRGRAWDNSARHKYDTLSYKLNFKDEGEDEEDDEAGFGGYRSFSMRYASVPVVFGKPPAVISVDSVK